MGATKHSLEPSVSLGHTFGVKEVQGMGDLYNPVPVRQPGPGGGEVFQVLVPLVHQSKHAGLQ